MAKRLKVFFPETTLKELKRREQSEKKEWVRVRFQAVRLVWEGKLKNKEIASFLQVHKNRIAEWVRRFNEGGFEGLEDRPGRGRKSVLVAEQMRQIRTWVEEGPDKNSPYSQWTGPLLHQHIQKEFDVEMSIDNVYKILKKLGLRLRRRRRYYSRRKRPVPGKELV